MGFFILIGLYFLPTLNAILKGSKCRNKEAIFFANLFFGWTVIGWFIVLVWSCTNKE